MRVCAIALAAGFGLRFKSKIPKILAEINSKPILIHSLLTLSRHPFIQEIIVVVNSKNSKSIIGKIRQYRIGRVSRIVEGGKRRQDSVLNGLKALSSRANLVLIHDAVRPFIDKNTISAVIEEAKNCGAAIVGVPVKATIKEVAGKIIVKKTLDRNNLWEIQTPQVFKKEIILKAYEKFGDIDVTDDSALVEKLGKKVSVVLGSYNNIKITTPEDLVIAEAIVKRPQSHHV
jgi:2-C-methyl-D-erythritol 4-phosphate cytidylyltransferase